MDYVKKIITYIAATTIIVYSIFIHGATPAQAHLDQPLVQSHLPLSDDKKMTLTQYNQCDPRWANLPLKPSTTTMCQSGCYITAIAMMIKNFAIADDPAQVLAKLIAVGGLDAQGFLTYSGLMRAYPQVYFYERGHTENSGVQGVQKTDSAVALSKILRRVRLGLPTVLIVDSYGGNAETHAVLLVDSDWTINDPINGTTGKFQAKYGDPLTKILGWISVNGSPVNFPADGDSIGGQTLYKIAQANKGINVGLNVKQALDVFMG